MIVEKSRSASPVRTTTVECRRCRKAFVALEAAPDGAAQRQRFLASHAHREPA